MSVNMKKLLGQVNFEIAEMIINEQTKFIQGIKESLELGHLKAQLREIPFRLMSQKKIVSQFRQVLEEAQCTLDQEEAILVSLIASEINLTNGKQVYSNKEARDAELIVRKKNSPTCQAAEANVKAAEQNLNEAQFDLERIQDEFRSLRITAQITCQELALLGLEKEEDNNNELY